MAAAAALATLVEAEEEEGQEEEGKRVEMPGKGIREKR